MSWVENEENFDGSQFLWGVNPQCQRPKRSGLPARKIHYYNEELHNVT